MPGAAVYMVHDVEIGTAITDVDGTVGSDLKVDFQLFQHCDFTVPGRRSQNAGNLAGRRFVAELRSENVLRRRNSFESGADHFPRSGRNHTKLEANTVPVSIEKFREQLYVVLQSDSPARFNKVLAPNTSKLRIMAQQVCQFRALMHQVGTGQARDLFLKPGNSQHFRQDVA